MPVPLDPDKYERPSIFAPADFIAYIRSRKQLPDDQAPPDGVILCYQAALYDHVTRAHSVTPHRGYFGRHLSYLDDTEGRVAIAGRFGVGAPAAAVMLEELLAFGCRRFVSIGTAGGLVRGLYPGHLVLCSGALRDEGLSYHYLPDGRPALPHTALTDAMGSALAASGLEYRRGLAWTTDAIYRETRPEMDARVAEGAVVVEMEAAALFAVAEYRAAPLAACFTISDSLAEPEWKPDFLHEDTAAGLERLYLAALSALSA